jgi:hypothetical protein
MVDTKKVVLFFGLLLVSSIFLSSGVFAYFDLGYSIDNAARSIQPLAQFFLGGFDYTGQLLFERFLVFLIIFSITFVALFKAPFFKDQKPAVVVLSLVVPLLSVRYINFEWMNTILMSYQVFGIAMTAFLPFVIYFFFLMGIAPNSPGVRKIGWILFGCVYLGLYTTAENQFYGQVYIWTALVSLLFLLLDGTIARTMAWNKVKASGKSTLQDAEVAIKRRMHELAIDLQNKVIDQDYYNNRMIELKKQQKALFKHTY